MLQVIKFDRKRVKIFYKSHFFQNLRILKLKRVNTAVNCTKDN